MSRVLEHTSPAELIGRFGQNPPTDLYGLAEALGLEIRGEHLPANISGKIEKQWFGSGYTITFNLLHARTRQRFTIAHEIAHYILHRDLIGDGIVDNALYRSETQSDPIERQASAYAAVILMPGPIVQAKFRSGVKSINGIAKLFDVSPEVAKIRMKELRLGP